VRKLTCQNSDFEHPRFISPPLGTKNKAPNSKKTSFETDSPLIRKNLDFSTNSQVKALRGKGIKTFSLKGLAL
jgi:hypothetical protein